MTLDKEFMKAVVEIGDFVKAATENTSITCLRTDCSRNGVNIPHMRDFVCTLRRIEICDTDDYKGCRQFQPVQDLPHPINGAKKEDL